MARKKIAVIFGGQKKRELSCRSAAAMIRALPESEYEVVPVGIGKRGSLLYFPGPAEEIEADTWESAPDCCRCSFSMGGAKPGLFKMLEDNETSFLALDVVVPLLYGVDGTEGSLQGLLQLGNLPFTGSSIDACVLCSDRELMAAILARAGIETVPAFTVNRGSTDISLLAEEIASTIFYPAVISTAHWGRMEERIFVTNEKELDTAIKRAFVYDSKVLVEKAVSGSQVVCAVLGSNEVTASPLAELIWEDDSIEMPAAISQELSYKARETAVNAFKALGCSGLAEVTLVIDPIGKIIVKEVNTLPDCSADSLCNKLFELVGVTPSMLWEKLIDFAEERAELGE